MNIIKSRQYAGWVFMLVDVGFIMSTIAVFVTGTDSLSLSRFIKALVFNPEIWLLG